MIKKVYKLQFDGKEFESESEQELRRLARNTEYPWELYMHVKSKFPSSGNQRLTIAEMWDCMRMHDRGITIKNIAKSKGLGESTVGKILQQLRKRESVIK